MLVWVIFFHYFGYLWSRIILQIHFSIFFFFVYVSETVLFGKFFSFLLILLFDYISVCFIFFTDAGSTGAVCQIIVIAFTFNLFSRQNFILSELYNLIIFAFFSFFLIYFFDNFWLLFLSLVLFFHDLINLFFHLFFCHVSSFNRIFPVLYIGFKTKVLIGCHFVLDFQQNVKLN